MIRKLLTWPVAALSWRWGMRIFFVYTGAQDILANPRYQSDKMLKAFFQLPPPPRSSEDSWLMIKGLFVTTFFLAAVMVFLNGKLQGRWWRKGLTFGGIAWGLIIPWFEFFLPYNVMHEPLPLVLFECALWLGVMLFVGLCVSATLNAGYRLTKRPGPKLSSQLSPETRAVQGP